MTSKDTKNSLIVYSDFTGDITKASIPTRAIWEIRPENRIVVGCGIYVAKCIGLEAEPDGFLGILTVEYYVEETQKKTESLQDKIIKWFTLDEEKILQKNIFYEDRKYIREWTSLTKDDYRKWVILGNKIHEKAIGSIKISIVNKQRILLSNELLEDLFRPIMNSLLSLYSSLGEF